MSAVAKKSHSTPRHATPRESSSSKLESKEYTGTSSCGRVHTCKQCPARNVDCRSCGKTGHFERVCMQKLNIVDLLSAIFSSLQRCRNPQHGLGAPTSHEGWSVDVLINKAPLRMKVDTGADVTAISPDTYHSSNASVKLLPSNHQPRGPDGMLLPG